MDITLDRASLLPIIAQAASVAQANATLPILTHLLVSAADDILQLIATDLERTITVQCQATINAPGMCTLPARKTFDIVRALPDGAVIRLRLDGERCVLTSGRGRYVLGSLPASDFPVTSPVLGGSAFDAAAAELAGLLRRTAFAAAKDDVRYYLNGVSLDLTGAGGVTVVATDGHRLASSRIALEGVPVQDRAIIIPRATVVELLKLLDKAAGAVRVELHDQAMQVTIGAVVFHSKLIDAQYPDWQRVVPRSLDRHATVNREHLLQTLKRVGVCSNEEYRGLRAEFEPGVLKLRAHNRADESGEEDIEIDYDGPPVVIGYNIGYLAEILNAIGSELVTMHFVDGSSSTRIENPDAPDDVFVIMPMRL